MSAEAANNSEKREMSLHGQNDNAGELVTPTTNNSNTKEELTGAPITAVDNALNELASEIETSPKSQNKRTPVKRTPKRMSFIERAQKESEELVKNLGGSLELEGGRRTRSSTRGTPTKTSAVGTPPPAKKARASPAHRGRGRKLDVVNEPKNVESTAESSKKTEGVDGAQGAKVVDNNDSEGSSIENPEKSVAGAANTAAAEGNLLETPKNSDSVAPKGSEAEDKIVVTAMVSIADEEQNNVDHCVKKPEKENPDSDKETNDGAKPSTELVPTAAPIAEAPVKDTEAALMNNSTSATDTVTDVIEKEPTPEPMEVDSPSSKENDVGSTETTAGDVEKEIPEAEQKASGSAEEEEEFAGLQATQTGSDSQAEKPEVSEAVKNDEVLQNDETVSNAVSDEKITLKPEEQSVEATVNSETEPAKEPIDTNKSDNDLAEPQIVSPSKTTDETEGVTPQYCN